MSWQHSKLLQSVSEIDSSISIAYWAQLWVKYAQSSQLGSDKVTQMGRSDQAALTGPCDKVTVTGHFDMVALTGSFDTIALTW